MMSTPNEQHRHEDVDSLVVSIPDHGSPLVLLDGKVADGHPPVAEIGIVVRYADGSRFRVHWTPEDQHKSETSWQDARGAIPWKPGDPPAEEVIRRIRDGT